MGCLRPQYDLVYHCRVIFERHHMWKHQFTDYAPGMGTWDWVVRGKPFQVSLNLIHHLVRFGVLVKSLLIWLAFIPQAEDALSGFAH